MRVLVFTTDDHLYPAGGAETAFGELATRMPDIEFDLICARLRPGASSREQVGNVRIHRIGFGVPKLDGYMLALFGHRIALRLHREHPFDLLWAIMASYGAFSAVRVKKATGLPFLLTLQEGDAPEDILRAVRPVRRAFDEIFRSADGLSAISTFLLSWGKEMGFRGTHAKRIPNGIDVATFAASQTSEEQARTRDSFGFPDNSFVLITSSRLVPKNGVGDIIEALALLPKEVCLVICGSGVLEKQLRARVRDLNLSDRVRFLGFVRPEALPSLLSGADAFIRPSRSEGLGNSFLEAMAARLPVIATPVGGIPDFLEDGDTGFFAAPADPASVAEAVTRVRNLTTTERQRVIDTAYARVTKDYIWDRIVVNMRSLFSALTT